MEIEFFFSIREHPMYRPKDRKNNITDSGLKRYSNSAEPNGNISTSSNEIL